MDMRKVRQLAKLMGEMNLSTLEITEGSTTIKLESKLSAGSSTVSPALPVQQAPVPAHTPEGADGTVTVTAPMVGVFYAASAPDAKPFVTLGDTVKKGDVLCIIEAMKLMNEITAEQSGTIVELCVGNGQVVEYGHPLFRIRP